MRIESCGAQQLYIWSVPDYKIVFPISWDKSQLLAADGLNTSKMHKVKCSAAHEQINTSIKRY